MNQQITLAEAEAAEAALSHQAALAQAAPELRRQRDADRRSAERAQSVSIAHNAAKVAIETARPALATWKADFMAWVVQGQALGQRLRDLEAPLFSALRELVGAIRAQQGQSRDMEHGEQLRQQTDRQAYTAFQSIGAYDPALAPFPQPGNGWAADMVSQMRGAVGRVYNPKAGADQFRRGRPGG